jgi:hypothetical protein
MAAGSHAHGNQHGAVHHLAGHSYALAAVADDPALPGKLRQLAYVKPGATLVSELQSSSDARILLPAWMNINRSANLSRG